MNVAVSFPNTVAQGLMTNLTPFSPLTAVTAIPLLETPGNAITIKYNANANTKIIISHLLL